MSYHFLVQRADRLGDAIFAIPVIEQLKRAYPSSTITVLTSSIGQTVFAPHPDVDEVIVTSAEYSWKAIWKQASQLRGQFTCYISLWNHPKLAVFGKWARIPIRIGDKTDFWNALFYTHPVRQSWEQLLRHQITFNLELLTPLDIKLQLEAGTIHLSPEAKTAVEPVFRIFSGKKTVLILVGTGGTNSPFPESSIIDFITLMETYHRQWKIILAGQQSQEKQLHSFQHPMVHNVINQTTLPELFAYIRYCDMYIGPDTGPTHIASYMKKPMVFFSSMKPNPPSRWGSLSPQQDVIRKDIDCHFFCAKRCYSDVCFRSVTGFVLLESFHQVLQQCEEGRSRTLSETRLFHFKHTLRVLAFGEASQWEHLKKEGLAVIHRPLTQLSLRQMRCIIQDIIRYNINVVYGPTSWILEWAIRLYMGIVAVYVVPVFIRRSDLPTTINKFVEYVKEKYEAYVPR